MNEKNQNLEQSNDRFRIGSDSAKENENIRLILEGTASETGIKFFGALVSNLAKVLDTSGAWITEYMPKSRRLRAKSFWLDGKFVKDYEYDIKGTPCEPVITDKTLIHIPDKVTVLFPDDPDLKPLNAVSYMGMPLFGDEESVIGHLAVLNAKPMPKNQQNEALFRIFAARAGAELRRAKAEEKTREQETQLSRLVDSAMDAIIEVNDQLIVTRANRAVARNFDYKTNQMLGKSINDFLDPESGKKLYRLTNELNQKSNGPQSLWIPGGIKARSADGKVFPAEASLSRFENKGASYYTLILRNLNEKIEAEKKIHSLESQTEYLKEELNEIQHFKSIIGSSSVLKQVLYSIHQVASIDTTVLILGETGTGKELVARAIHNESRRSEQQLIKLNCATIPNSLIESELFGHEKGAFTGATQKRQGRFALADGGTLFLDEIGELPVDVQAKLLRVLQEGEFEPLGSSKTYKVDVRVIAATNRDLEQGIIDGTFREDLFYRLSVFPITIPPLRDRDKDVLQLAESFANTFSQKIDRPVEPFSDQDRVCLLSYHWPGNVRELQNVIERAVIISQSGHLNIAEIIGGVAQTESPTVGSIDNVNDGAIMSVFQIRDLERTNIERALIQCDWKLSGNTGAASLLGIPPSTLASRMKALKISKPK
jgi:PAS domain S-box-containing protein